VACLADAARGGGAQAARLQDLLKGSVPRAESETLRDEVRRLEAALKRAQDANEGLIPRSAVAAMEQVCPALLLLALLLLLLLLLLLALLLLLLLLLLLALLALLVLALLVVVVVALLLLVVVVALLQLLVVVVASHETRGAVVRSWSRPRRRSRPAGSTSSGSVGRRAPPARPAADALVV
jgi:hypothetical protein